MKNKLAFDIGCNIGNYTLKLLESGYDVIAVDPSPHLFVNVPKGVTRIFSACSNNCEEVDFYFSPESTISTADLDWIKNSRFSDRKQWYRFKVPSVTIDSLVNQFGVPDHIKIDVEGYEFMCLQGMSAKYSNKICFEWAEEKGESALDCVNYLSNLGYEEFGYIFNDEYMAEPNSYFSKNQFFNEFKFDKLRKELWGMIWAK